MPNTWIFNPGDPPQIVWRDTDEVRWLDFKGPLNVRWFNARLDEATVPNEPGRWIAWVDGIAPRRFPGKTA